MRKITTLTVVMLVFLLAPFAALADTVKFVKEYIYQASDIDSKVSSRAIALEQVKRALLEQLGTYLISETEVKNFKLTKDQITTLTAGIVSAEVIEEKWDGRRYYLKAKITADPKEVAKSVDALRADVQKSKELDESKKKAEEAMREVERLKKELELVKGDTKKQGDYANAIKDLSASDWFDRGLTFQKSNNLQNAIDAYDKAIELSPKDAAAYINRGTAYAELGNHQQAINNYNWAIGLNPKEADAYVNRGIAYVKAGNIQQAINDYNKAMELNPKDATAYNNRGNAYCYLGNYQRGINDFNKAIELNPNEWLPYNNRGAAYDRLELHIQALKDFDQVLKINPQSALAWSTRGDTYSKLGNYQKAIQDYSKAIELDSRYVGAYVNRGIAFARAKDHNLAGTEENYNLAGADLEKALDLEPTNANAQYNLSIVYISISKELRQAGAGDTETVKIYDKISRALMIKAAQLGNNKAQDFLRTREISW